MLKSAVSTAIGAPKGTRENEAEVGAGAATGMQAAVVAGAAAVVGAHEKLPCAHGVASNQGSSIKQARCARPKTRGAERSLLCLQEMFSLAAMAFLVNGKLVGFRLARNGRVPRLVYLDQPVAMRTARRPEPRTSNP